MNIFERSIQIKFHNLEQVQFLDRPFTTRDLYFSDIVAIHFIVGQEIYFYIIKNNNKNNYMKIDILSSIELQDVISNEDIKVLSIELESLRDNQFVKEKKEIQKYIRQVGGSNDEQINSSYKQ